MGKPNVVVVNINDRELVAWLRAQAKARDRSLSALIRLFIKQGKRRLDQGELLPEDVPDRESAA